MDMTLDEAIKHAEEVAERKDKEAYNWEDYDMDVFNIIAECKQCAAEHRQLAEWLKDYKRLLERESCEDAISRQAAIDALKEHRALYCDNTPETFSKLSYTEKSRVDELDAAIATLVNLPSAQPERKKGKWIKEYWNGKHTRKCSACNITQTVTTYKGKVNFNFCPYCGAKMVESEDNK